MALVRKASYEKSLNNEEIEAETALQRLKSSGLLSLPIDVYSVAEFLGVDIKEEVMDDELSGFIEPGRSGWVIGVNSYHHPNRQRFTIAHEIGHFLLHKPSEKHVDITFARRAGTRDKIENEADKFAAGLLMPEKEVRERIAAGENSLEKLAASFGVSVMAVKYRVQSLGYSVR
jgi:predicted transcriptional regulator